jgi:RNA polymerase sigma factor for flagellar operon FliA
MNLISSSPKEISWVGQTETWPLKDKNWGKSRQDLFFKFNEWSNALALKLFAIYKVEGLERNDYMQYATMGLLESIDRFDPSHGCHFKYYARKRIQGAILNHIVKFSEKAHAGYARKKLVQTRLADFEWDKAGMPGCSPEASLVDAILDLATGFLFETNVQDHQNSLFNDGEMHTMVERVHDEIAKLNEKQRLIMELHYKEGKSFIEVSEALSLTAGRVSQLHSEAIKVIRKKLSWSS